MVVHLQSNGGTLRNELDDEVLWRHLTNSHVIEENRHQKNVKATYINNEMFQRSLTASNPTFLN